jgi:hypothetical protein
MIERGLSFEKPQAHGSPKRVRVPGVTIVENRLSSIRPVSWCLTTRSSRGGKGEWSFKSLSLFWYCSLSL